VGAFFQKTIRRATLSSLAISTFSSYGSQ
jgi:hypothetical protein